MSNRLISMFLAIALVLNQPGLGLAYTSASTSLVSASSGLLGMRISDGQFVLGVSENTDKDALKRELSYFLTALAVPSQQWWVNLNILVDESMVVGKGLAYTSLGRALLSADLELKRRAMELISQSLMPSDLGEQRFRLWIEPKEIRVTYDGDEVKIEKASLGLRIKGKGGTKIEGYLKGVLEELEKELNTAPEFADLRRAYQSMILAVWYKKHLRGKVPVLDATVDNYALPTGGEDFWSRRDFLKEFAELYRRGAVDDSSFVVVNAGGFNGTVIPEKVIPLKVPSPLSTAPNTKLVQIGLSEGPVKAQVAFRVYGDVDSTGIVPQAPLAIVSEAPGRVGLKLKGPFGNEIIFITKSGKVKRIRAPKEDERGVFIAKDKAVVINSRGEIYEKTFSPEEIIKFGTSGWRFTMPDSEDKEGQEKFLKKMEKALEGFARFYLENKAYFQSKYGSDREGVVIARDGRRMGKDFVNLAVKVLSRYGIPVVYFDEPITTPEVAYAVAKHKALFAINFTASHNPPEYNGFKVTPADGGAAEEEITDLLARRANESINDLAEPYEAEPVEPIRLDHEELIRGYVDYVKKTLTGRLGEGMIGDLITYIKENDIKIIPTALHGAGGKVILQVLKGMFGEDRVLEGEDLKLDPREDFGGLSHPEPDQSRTRFLAEKVKAMSSPAVGVALDGDADRFGVIDSKGNFVSANQFIGLVLFFFNDIGRKGGVAKTVPTSDLPLALARHYGARAEETKVGFKWMKAFWDPEDFVVAGEESAHVGLPGTATWDDGIMMSTLAVLMEAYFLKKYGNAMSEMVSYVQKEVLGKFYDYKRENVNLTPELKKTLSDLFSRLKDYSAGQDRVPRRDLRARFGFVNWDRIETDSGKKIREVVLLDGVKVVFEDGSWFAIRLSGTEPVARLYVEGSGKDPKGAEASKNKLLEVGRKFLDGGYLGDWKNRGAVDLGSLNKRLSRLRFLGFVVSTLASYFLLPHLFGFLIPIIGHVADFLHMGKLAAFVKFAPDDVDALKKLVSLLLSGMSGGLVLVMINNMIVNPVRELEAELKAANEELEQRRHFNPKELLIGRFELDGYSHVDELDSLWGSSVGKDQDIKQIEQDARKEVKELGNGYIKFNDGSYVLVKQHVRASQSWEEGWTSWRVKVEWGAKGESFDDREEAYERLKKVAISYARAEYVIEGNSMKEGKVEFEQVLSRREAEAYGLTSPGYGELDIEQIEKDAGKKVRKISWEDGVLEIKFQYGSYIRIPLNSVEIPLSDRPGDNDNEYRMAIYCCTAYLGAWGGTMQQREELYRRLEEVAKNLWMGSYTITDKEQRKEKGDGERTTGRIDLDILLGLLLLMAGGVYLVVRGVDETTIISAFLALSVVGGAIFVSSKLAKRLEEALDWELLLVEALNDVDEYNYRSYKSWRRVVEHVRKRSPVFARYLVSLLLLNGLQWEGEIPEVDILEVSKEDVRVAESFFEIWQKKVKGGLLPEDLFTKKDLDRFERLAKASRQVFYRAKGYGIQPRIGVYYHRGKLFLGWYANEWLFPVRELSRNEEDFVEFVWFNVLNDSWDYRKIEELNGILDRMQSYYGDGFTDQVRSAVRTLMESPEFRDASAMKRLWHLATFERRLALGSGLMEDWLVSVIMAQGLGGELVGGLTFYGGWRPIGYEVASSILRRTAGQTVKAKGGIDLSRVSFAGL